MAGPGICIIVFGGYLRIIGASSVQHTIYTAVCICCDSSNACRLCRLESGILVCCSFLISVCMFIVSISWHLTICYFVCKNYAVCMLVGMVF